MKLEIHPKASVNFNTKIKELKDQLRFEYEPNKAKKNPDNPNIHISAAFDETNIIGELKSYRTDLDGNITARAFGVRGKFLGLFDEDYKKFTSNCRKFTEKH